MGPSIQLTCIMTDRVYIVMMTSDAQYTISQRLTVALKMMTLFRKYLVIFSDKTSIKQAIIVPPCQE